MMKGAAEKAVQIQVMPGQAGARQAPRARMGGDQLPADFEGLLARRAVVRDTPLDKPDSPAADSRMEHAPRATPEALFLALAGGAEVVVQKETVAPRREDDSGDDGEPAKLDDAQSHPFASRPPTPTVPIEPGALQPPTRKEMGEERPVVKDEAPSSKLAVAIADTMPIADEMRADASLVPADVDDVSPRNGAAGRVATEKKSSKLAEEPPVAGKAMKEQENAPPDTLIRVVGQETHFAPPLAPVIADQKIDSLPLRAAAEPDGPGRPQPALPPVAVQLPNGPLRTLKVELGSHELGLVNATVALRQKALDLKIGAARDDTVASLKENAGKLSDALQALGYSVDSVSVQKMPQSDAGNQTGNGQPAQQGAGGQGQGQQRTPGGSENSSGQPRYAHHDDHLAEQEGNDQPKATAVSRHGRGVFL